MTWNPWRGCEKISPGCKFCYAEKQAKRNPKVLGEWGPGAPRVRGVESYLALPAKWNELASRGRFVQCVCGRREFRKWDTSIPLGGLSCCKTPDCLALPETESSPVRPRVFCLSFGDWLDESVPIEWLVHLLETIRTTPHLDWLLLTKRPENFRKRLGIVAAGSRGRNEDLLDWLWEWVIDEIAPPNVWVGASVEDQKRADERIPDLLKIPAKVRFLSCEPLLGPIEFSNVSGRSDAVLQLGKKAVAGINWVIVGGESGSKENARPCALEWVDGIRRQCEAAEVPCFVKQLGSRPYVENANLWDWPVDDELGLYCDPPESVKAFAAVGVMLKHPKGGDWEEWPEPLRVRQFPKL